MNNLTVEYKSSVNTAAGWRSVYIKAKAEKLSEKRVGIIELTHIDNELVSKNMSRTGSNRQKFDGQYFANQEVGKKKNISSLYDISEIKHD